MEDTFYRRNLPHFPPGTSPIFVTTRLIDSLPAAAVHKLRVRREAEIAQCEKLDGPLRKQGIRDAHVRFFAGYDALLDTCSTGPNWLGTEAIATLVHQEILALQDREHTVWVSTVMPNHIHLVTSPLKEGLILHEQLRLVKGRSERFCNQVLSRKGAFWQEESYDHVVREKEFWNVIRYVAMNPVKAGLVDDWSEWPWTYLNPKLEF